MASTDARTANFGTDAHGAQDAEFVTLMSELPTRCEAIVRSFMALFVCWIAMSGSVARCVGAEKARGYRAKQRVAGPTRLDWTFPVARRSIGDLPDGYLPDYKSKAQSYELFVPTRYNKRRKYPAVIFVSPSPKAMGFQFWNQTCRKNEILFAGPHRAGNRCPASKRFRIVLDVLDDLIREYNIDPDRTYIVGFSGGARIACLIAFSLPEHFGGVIPICAGHQLPRESWLRQRVIDRISVVNITGKTDFSRSEVERRHHPLFAAMGIRSQLRVIEMGHEMPNSAVLNRAYRWLEEGVEQRRQLAERYPASRINDAPSREEWATRLLDEAQLRLTDPQTLHSGLMQLKGIRARWEDLPQAVEAQAIHDDYASEIERPWEEEEAAESRQYLIARARAMDNYASGPFAKRVQYVKGSMLEYAIQLWKAVQRDGQDTAAVEQANNRIPVLEEMLVE